VELQLSFRETGPAPLIDPDFRKESREEIFFRVERRGIEEQLDLYKYIFICKLSKEMNVLD
jgi:hypothetical protein